MGFLRIMVNDESTVGGCATLWSVHYDAYRGPVDWGQHWLQPDATKTTVDDLHRGRPHQLPAWMVLLACAGCRYSLSIGWTDNINHRFGVATPILNDSRGLLRHSLR